MGKYVNIIRDVNKKNKTIKFIRNEFKKVITENIFFQNLKYLLKNSKEIPFKSEWNFNVQKCSFDVYGDREFYPIIMLVNNIPSFFEFHSDNFDKLFIPNLDSIMFIIYDLS